MKLMTLKQYMKMTKPALIRKITKALKAMPKKRLAMVCYNITKSKLPRLRVKEPISSLEFEMRRKPSPDRIQDFRKVKKNGYYHWIKKPKRKTKKIVGEIYHTKNGQPYEILKGGKARFLKK